MSSPKSVANVQPGSIDLALRMLSVINTEQYHLKQEIRSDGLTVYKVFLKDAYGYSTELVAVVTYDARRGSILLQQVFVPLAEEAEMSECHNCPSSGKVSFLPRLSPLAA